LPRFVNYVNDLIAVENFVRQPSPHDRGLQQTIGGFLGLFRCVNEEWGPKDGGNRSPSNVGVGRWAEKITDADSNRVVREAPASEEPFFQRCREAP
jgi:hypothetical protein